MIIITILIVCDHFLHCSLYSRDQSSMWGSRRCERRGSSFFPNALIQLIGTELDISAMRKHFLQRQQKRRSHYYMTKKLLAPWWTNHSFDSHPATKIINYPIKLSNGSSAEVNIVHNYRTTKHHLQSATKISTRSSRRTTEKGPGITKKQLSHFLMGWVICFLNLIFNLLLLPRLS